MKTSILLFVGAITLGGRSAQAATAAAPTVSLTPEQEQTYATQLSQCFALKSTGEDRLALARWFAAALASAPQLAGVAQVDKASKDALDRQVAGLFTRLMVKDCAEFSRPLSRARSAQGFRAAGETLGRLAVEELLNDPKAAAATLGGYLSYIREEDFAALRN